ncbi:MAG: 30S ribosomal protein S1 [Leptospiraceae bacterium]|nr:30S ribosomal protein S1 [Leptospiraceae bacterium]MCP5493403.1 30S ribosomal protein S1 [Leptospiraceae bacterium]
MNSVNSISKENQNLAFAKLLEQSEQEQISFGKGALVEGKIVAIDETEKTVYVTIGLKTDGRLPLGEFDSPPEIGSDVSIVVKSREKESGIYVLSKREADFKKGWETIKDSYKKNISVEGVVEGLRKRGFNVKVENINLFLPLSHAGGGGKKTPSLGELKNKLLSFKILKLNEKNKTGVISRKSLLDEINKEKWDELVKEVHIGDKVVGEVTKIASFGVFCKVHGIEGLLRQNDISYKKYAPFKQYFKVGQQVELMVLDLNPEDNRLSLGLKQLYEDPWEWARRELEKEMVVRGIVTSLTNFGAFVELKAGLEGLIHTSELSWAKKPPHPKEILKKGQEVDSVILDIDFESKRLSLGLKQLIPNPWDNLSPKVAVNSVLEGKITGITKYGAFVEVENGIEGLIHIGDITWDEKVKDPTVSLKKGQVVQYKILEVDKNSNRISCGLKQLEENPYELLRKKYPSGTIVEGKIKSVVSFGIFIEIEPGYEGLVHVSQIPESKDIKLEEIYRVGEPIKAVILKIESELKKISLSIKDYDRVREREEMAKYIKSDDSPSSESLSSLINSKLK